MTDKKDDKSTWAVGGGLMLGIGAGFFFLPDAPMYFVGCILMGLGLGLMVTSFLARKKQAH